MKATPALMTDRAYASYVRDLHAGEFGLAWCDHPACGASGVDVLPYRRTPRDILRTYCRQHARANGFTVGERPYEPAKETTEYDRVADGDRVPKAELMRSGDRTDSHGEAMGDGAKSLPVWRVASGTDEVPVQRKTV